MPSHLLSTETTRLRDTIRSSLHAYLDLSRSLNPPAPTSQASRPADRPAISDGSSSDPSTALAALSLAEASPSAASDADFVEIELPRGISSRPHALDRIRPRALREGDRLRAVKRQAAATDVATTASSS